MDKTKIEWTDATWNPLRGCSKVSSGCKNCYAEKMAARFSERGQPYEGTITDGKWNGKVRFISELLEQPLRWKHPRRIFVNSMSDLFHENVPDDFIDKIFAVMIKAKKHTFQILTKRPERMKNYIIKKLYDDNVYDDGLYEAVDEIGANEDFDPTLPNVWLGVSCEDKQTANERIPLLLQTPAAVRFISAEPLLDSIDLVQSINRLNWLDEESLKPGGIDWVICGGESGANARPMNPEWARSLKDQCHRSGVKFFFKQWGKWASEAGRLLDGREWNEFPGENND